MVVLLRFLMNHKGHTQGLPKFGLGWLSGVAESHASLRISRQSILLRSRRPRLQVLGNEAIAAQVISASP